MLKVRYGVIVHPDHGPVLIDTGYTAETISAPDRGRVLRLYSRVLGPTLNPDQQPEPVLARLGFTPADVRFVIVTHFHADHISGLRQFPNARFIANGPAFAHLRSSTDWHNIRHGVFPELVPDDFDGRMIDTESLPRTEPEYGLPAGRDLLGDGRVVAVGLPGHARGLFGVMLQTASGPLLYAVDVQWIRRAATEARVQAWPARLITDDYEDWRRSTDALTAYLAQGHAALLCHDPENTPFDYDMANSDP